MQWKQWNIKNIEIKTLKCKDNAVFLQFNGFTLVVFTFHYDCFVCLSVLIVMLVHFTVFNVFTVNLAVFI